MVWGDSVSTDRTSPANMKVRNRINNKKIAAHRFRWNIEFVYWNSQGSSKATYQDVQSSVVDESANKTVADSYSWNKWVLARCSNVLKCRVFDNLSQENVDNKYKTSDRPYLNGCRPGMTNNNFWSSHTYRSAFVCCIDLLQVNDFVESV